MDPPPLLQVMTTHSILEAFTHQMHFVVQNI